MTNFCFSLIEFVSRNEGQIIGSFLGALLASLIAIYAAKKAHFYAEERDNMKSLREENQLKNKYCNILHSVIIELNWHQEINPMIINQVEGIRQNSKDVGRMIIDEPTTFIRTDYLRKLRNLLYEFDFANLVIPTHIQLYINSSENINRSLNLKVIDKTVERFKEPKKFGAAVDLYFNQLIKDFTRLDKALTKVLQIALTEIDRFPNAEVHKIYDHPLENKDNSL